MILKLVVQHKQFLFGALFTLILTRILNTSTVVMEANTWMVANQIVDNPQTMIQGWPDNSSFFCKEWNTNLDAWWTHQPEWEASYENDTHYCFSRVQDTEKAQFFRSLYEVQFNGNCSNVFTNNLWGSGWSANFWNIVNGLLHALESGNPVQTFLTDLAWNYAGNNRDGRSNLTCPSKDVFCYYLNHSSCAGNPENVTGGAPNLNADEKTFTWGYQYATRPQVWLRHEIYNYTKSAVQISTPCTVLHVRRGDVGMDESNRPYYALKEYFDAANGNLSHNIFLLTDDQNAVDEALTEYPQYNWMYIKRPRFRGHSGGWQNHVPSTPKQEVIVIESIFRMAGKCEKLVHTPSGFSHYIYRAMRAINDGAERIEFSKPNPDPPTPMHD